MSATKSQVGTSKNTLNQKQQFQLAKWIEGNLSRISPAWDKDVAVLATKELGFPVTQKNVQSVCDSADIEISRPRGTGETSARNRRPSIAAERTLALELQNLMRSLGQEPSRALRDLLANLGE